MNDWKEGFLCGVLALLPNALSLPDAYYGIAYLCCMALVLALIFRPRTTAGADRGKK